MLLTRPALATVSMVVEEVGRGWSFGSGKTQMSVDPPHQEKRWTETVPPHISYHTAMLSLVKVQV
jgi:hypothetical protein